MSFILDGVTYYEDLDFPSISYYPGHPFAPQWILCTKNGKRYRAPYTIFSASNHAHTTIVADSNNLARVYNSGGTGIWIKVYQGNFQFSANPDQLKNLIFQNFKSIYTTPSGTATYFYADGFVEYSSQELKDNIRPIDNVVDRVKTLKAKRYDVAGIPSIGFVAEENPPEVINRNFDSETQKEEKGVNLSAILGIISESINQSILPTLADIETRLTALEKKAGIVRGGML